MIARIEAQWNLLENTHDPIQSQRDNIKGPLTLCYICVTLHERVPINIKFDFQRGLVCAHELMNCFL